MLKLLKPFSGNMKMRNASMRFLCLISCALVASCADNPAPPTKGSVDHVLLLRENIEDAFIVSICDREFSWREKVNNAAPDREAMNQLFNKMKDDGVDDGVARQRAAREMQKTMEAAMINGNKIASEYGCSAPYIKSRIERFENDKTISGEAVK